MAMIFIVSAAIAGLSILSAFLQYKKDKEIGAERLKAANELNVAYKKLQEKSDELQKKSDQIISTTEKISQLQSDLIVANGKIETLQEEVINQVTGGKIELAVLPLIPLQLPNTVQFGIQNNGKYPVSNITITVGNATLMLKELQLSGNPAIAYNNSKVDLPTIGSLASGDFITIYSTTFPTEDNKEQFTVTVRYRNGVFMFSCIFERDNKGKIRILSQGLL